MKKEYADILMPYFENAVIPDIPEARPLVSVLMPYHNSSGNTDNPDYLREAVSSVLEQGWREWELFVADDASADRSAEAIVHEYHDARIKCIRLEENRGAAVARNAAFAVSRGEFILVIAMHVLEHVADDRKTISELFRMLKTGGYCLRPFLSTRRRWKTRQSTRRTARLGPAYATCAWSHCDQDSRPLYEFPVQIYNIFFFFFI